jgi:large subunit ribosomal protein L13
MAVTYTPQKEILKQHWHFVDLEGKVLGRIAVDIAKHLMGKNKATFTRNINVGDKVVITNAEKVKVTGKKLKDKLYIWHTGYPKGLREVNLASMLEKHPERVIEEAVKNMLPNNKLRKERMSNMYVYKGSEHPHQAHKVKEEVKE